MHSNLDNGFTYQGTHYTGDQAAIAEGDNFLSTIVPDIMASKAWKKNGAIVIWFDETEGGNTTDYTLPLVVISRLAQGNAFNSTLVYTHSSGLKSMEELFGVYAPGGGFLGDANTPGTNDYSDLFVSGALQPSTPQGNGQIGLQGVGALAHGDPGLSGLIVSVTGINIVNSQDFKVTTTSSRDGSHSSTELLPGTFTMTITAAPGLQNDSTIHTSSGDNITLGADPTTSGPDFGVLNSAPTGALLSA
jgi:hypothetical protein